MDWLFSNGIVALQLLMVSLTLAGVVVLVQWKWTMKRLYEEMAAERAKAVLALEKRAEELAAETAEIARVHAHNLSTELGKLFDAVGQTQTHIQTAVEKTSKILEIELRKPGVTELDAAETTRETIEAIKESTERLENKDAETTAPPRPDERRQASRQNDTARTECYQRLRDVMKNAVEKYYDAHPDRYKDARGNEAMRISVKGLELMLSILSEYPIGDRYTRAKP